MTPTLDVVIVNFNGRDDLSACLESLHEEPPKCLQSIVVVDNASTDGSQALVRDRWPAVKLVALDRNVGFGAANNRAMRESTAELLLLLNSDTLVPVGSIDRLVDRLLVTSAVAAGPKLVDPRGRPEVSYGRMLSPWTELAQSLRARLATHEGGFAARYVDRLVADEHDVDWVSGACLLVRRRPALDAGLFDERYFLYEEDVDFCAALRARGGRILFTPRAEVVHLRGRSVARTGEGSRKAYDRSHLLFYEKHAPRWAVVLAWWKRLRGRPIDR